MVFVALMRAIWFVAVAVLVAACGGGRHDWDVAPRPVDPEKYAVPVHVGARISGVTDADLAALWARQIMVPVAGIARESLRDHFMAARDGARTHHAIDILAPKSTPVLAADDCVIGRLSTGGIGGIVIYATDPDQRFVYYYAHLDRYRRGLAVGDRIAKGSVIGYVGTTGNASEKTPHLHFQVMKRGAGRAWWSGVPINPYSFFALDGARLLSQSAWP
ncbi:MAG: hypothetical protein RLZZ621_2207 [Gemmatimonadota bacterium]